MSKKIEYTKLKPHIKKQWVEAMRSGVYKQGMGCLLQADDNCYRFCCLGVLSNLHAQAQRKPHIGFIKNIAFTYSDGNKKSASDLTSKVKNWAFQCDNGDNPVGKLTDMNDSGYSFQMIADWIDENL